MHWQKKVLHLSHKILCNLYLSCFQHLPFESNTWSLRSVSKNILVLIISFQQWDQRVWWNILATSKSFSKMGSLKTLLENYLLEPPPLEQITREVLPTRIFPPDNLPQKTTSNKKPQSTDPGYYTNATFCRKITPSNSTCVTPSLFKFYFTE